MFEEHDAVERAQGSYSSLEALCKPLEGCGRGWPGQTCVLRESLSYCVENRP